jgi:hypothetical protein
MGHGKSHYLRLSRRCCLLLSLLRFVFFFCRRRRRRHHHVPKRRLPGVRLICVLSTSPTVRCVLGGCACTCSISKNVQPMLWNWLQIRFPGCCRNTFKCLDKIGQVFFFVEYHNSEIPDISRITSTEWCVSMLARNVSQPICTCCRPWQCLKDPDQLRLKSWSGVCADSTEQLIMTPRHMAEIWGSRDAKVWVRLLFQIVCTMAGGGVYIETGKGLR